MIYFIKRFELNSQLRELGYIASLYAFYAYLTSEFSIVRLSHSFSQETMRLAFTLDEEFQALIVDMCSLENTIDSLNDYLDKFIKVNEVVKDYPHLELKVEMLNDSIAEVSFSNREGDLYSRSNKGVHPFKIFLSVLDQAIDHIATDTLIHFTGADDALARVYYKSLKRFGCKFICTESLLEVSHFSDFYIIVSDFKEAYVNKYL